MERESERETDRVEGERVREIERFSRTLSQLRQRMVTIDEFARTGLKKAH